MIFMYCGVAQMWPTMMGGGMWFWFLIIAGLGYLFWASYRPSTHRYIRDDPVEVARTRLARGEITLEEFERIKKAIESR